MKRARKNETTICHACNGRGWRDIGYVRTTIADIMPHGEHSYMCSSCHGTGMRSTSRRIAMVIGRKLHHIVRKRNRNTIWRVYRTAVERQLALKDIKIANGGRLHYVMDWIDSNGFGLHVQRRA